jgi:hypothetical protein
VSQKCPQLSIPTIILHNFDKQTLLKCLQNRVQIRLIHLCASGKGRISFANKIFPSLEIFHILTSFSKLKRLVGFSLTEMPHHSNQKYLGG